MKNKNTFFMADSIPRTIAKEPIDNTLYQYIIRISPSNKVMIILKICMYTIFEIRVKLGPQKINCNLNDWKKIF